MNSAGRASPRIGYSFLKLMTGSDLANRRLPMIGCVSPNPGPLVWLTACSHGDEVGGIAVIHDLFRRLQRQLLRGAVHAFPLMNPLGFESGTRNITISREDLNRSFPGNLHGSLGERIAARIFTRILDAAPDLVLDLHNDWIRSIPFALLDPATAALPAAAYERTCTLARETGLCTIIETDAVEHSLTYNLLARGIPAITLELGESRVVNEIHVVSGIGAIWNVLAHLGLVAPLTEPFRYPLPPRYAQGDMLQYSDKPVGSKSGIIRFLVEPGTEIKAGQAFARITNAFGKHQETVKATQDAIVLGHSDSAAVFPGMPIMAFGIEV
ncbi:MAG: succinylglutamate desuccinylase/aspartoacylase family protein [Gammaproteobacteria bacterium]|nr:succinylglutamate desuccinylase/aspartoacylase family protein [Gammaproteobacteria bacterium]